MKPGYIVLLILVAFSGFLYWSGFSARNGGERLVGGDSGVRGSVLLGPTCPVERVPPDPGCADRPYQTTLAITTPDGARVIKEFTSEENGSFRVDVLPGLYAIRSAAAANILPYCASDGVFEVNALMYTDVLVNCDSGIR